MRIERGGYPLAAQSNTQPGVIGFAFLFDIAVPGAPRRGFALMDQGPCADWKETQRRALSKTVQRRQFSQMRARSPALHRLERKFIWMTEPDRAAPLSRLRAHTSLNDIARRLNNRARQRAHSDRGLGGRARPSATSLLSGWAFGRGRHCIRAARAQPECNAVRAQTPIQIAGLLQTAAHDRLILYRYAPAGARDYLSAWLCHLVMCARAGAKEAPRTIWLGHPDEFAFKPVQRGRARAHLAELAALYGFGQCAPLRFFPISAWALVHQGEAAARRAWNGDVKKKGEANDAWLRIALRGERLSAALDAHFSALARTVLTPLIEYLEVIS